MPSIMSSHASRWWFPLFVSISLCRLGLGLWLPLTGDEAYFYFWGWQPAGGFYDHPPMVGWWLAGLNQLSDHPLVLRLPALVVPIVIGLLARQWLLNQTWCDQRLANAISLLVLLAPLNVWNVAITTDVPLMFFAALATLAYLQANNLNQYRLLRSANRRDVDAYVWYLLAGLALGGALMSKYFAGLLALGFAAHVMFGRVRERWIPLLLLIAGSVPAAIWQGLWNAENCWPNLMFNLVNRHDNAALGWRNSLLYIVSVAYVLGPGLVGLYLFRSSRGRTSQQDGSSTVRNALGWIVVVPLLLFGVLSLIKPIGLHWLAAFVLPGVLWIALGFTSAMLHRAVTLAAWFAALHWVVIITAAAVPLKTWQDVRMYPGLVMTLQPQAMRVALREYLDPEVAARPEVRPSPIRDWIPKESHGRILASDGYSAAVTLSMALGRRVVVFGPGSSHARHDDILTDWQAAQGHKILIVRRDKSRQVNDARFFERVEFRSIVVDGARFELTLGDGFKFETYRDDVLEQIRAQYYAVPPWLARWSTAPCYFCQRYFPQRTCHR